MGWHVCVYVCVYTHVARSDFSVVDKEAATIFSIALSIDFTVRGRSNGTRHDGQECLVFIHSSIQNKQKECEQSNTLASYIRS